jgi:hypothetical protein
MNERGYKTPRGNSFRNAHAHSILKKKRIKLAYKPDEEMDCGLWDQYKKSLKTLTLSETMHM